MVQSQNNETIELEMNIGNMQEIMHKSRGKEREIFGR